jgi:hypothetical protein
LRSRFTDIELPPWSLGEDLRDFVTRLTWSLPLREPSPVDSPKLRHLLVERTGGITLGICKAFERAAVAAIRGGEDGSRQLRRSGNLAGRGQPEPAGAWSGACCYGAIARMRCPALPMAPRPYPGEAISSWVHRIAARYDIGADDFVRHMLGWRSFSFGRAERLDHRADAQLEDALAMAVDAATVKRLRIVRDDGSATSWHRTTPAWCPACLRHDLVEQG